MGSMSLNPADRRGFLPVLSPLNKELGSGIELSGLPLEHFPVPQHRHNPFLVETLFHRDPLQAAIL